MPLSGLHTALSRSRRAAGGGEELEELRGLRVALGGVHGGVGGGQDHQVRTGPAHGLAARGVTRVMVEAGPILSAAFLAADLVDEAALFRSPEAIGAGIDALEGMPLSTLTLSPKLRLVGSEQVGADTLQMFERK